MAERKIYYHRRLPHWHPTDTFLFVTFSLYGSIPNWKREGVTSGQAFVLADRELDCATSGPLWLRRDDVAEAVVGTLQAAVEKALVEIGGFVVMRNHVHLLVKPLVAAPEALKWIKGVSAREANQRLGRIGQPFWGREYYDHWVRDSREYRRILHYIEWNPVHAGLVASPELWGWSSATTG